MLNNNYNKIKAAFFFFFKVEVKNLPNKLAVSWKLLCARVEQEEDLERTSKSSCGFCAKALDLWIQQIKERNKK